MKRIQQGSRGYVLRELLLFLGLVVGFGLVGVGLIVELVR